MNVIAVDVGTTSVRLAVISFQGDGYKEASVVASRKRAISHHQNGVKFEQNSREIWQAICDCCRECLSTTNIPIDSIKSIAFSATCSLVIAKEQGNIQQPEDAYDIIMWMDHRATEEARKITNGTSNVLNQFGGVCSPEFSLAKLVWLKNHRPKVFQEAKGFFELPDWLVYRCIGDDAASCPRSLCCLTCKWGYNAEVMCHCDIVDSLDANLFRKTNKKTLGPGTISGWLSPTAASELGLADAAPRKQDKENMKPLKVAVGTSLIDAHSGMLAMLSVPLGPHGLDLKIESTFCSLAGTSSCHMLLSRSKNFTRGIWGPYKSVVIEGYYLLEAGQSLTGKLIEICIESHEEGKKRLANHERMYDIIASLNEQYKTAVETNAFKRHLHILPTFHGNRSPLANSRLRGGVYGLSAEGPRSLLEYYVATLESLAYETRLIVEALGSKLETMLVSGGLMKNSLFMQTLADVLGCRVVKMSLEDIDFMVMGSALVARHSAILAAQMQEKDGAPLPSEPLTESSIEGLNYRQLDVDIFKPDPNQLQMHERRFLCYKEFVDLSLKIDKILNLD